MNWRLLTIILALTFLSHSTTYAQDIFEKISDTSRKGQGDAAMNLIDSTENYFIENEKWDSLGKLYLTKSEVIIRFSGHTQAQESYDKARKIIDQHHLYNSWTFKEYLVSHSNSLIILGDYQDASEEIEHLLKITSTKKDKVYHIQGLKNKVLLNIYKYDFETADSLMDIIIPKVAQTTIDTFTIISIYSYKRYLDMVNSRLESALYYAKLNRDLTLKMYSPDHPNVGISYSNLGDIYEEMGMIERAFQYLNMARQIYYNEYQKTENPHFFAQNLSATGLLYSRLGEYKLATDYMEYSLKLQKEIQHEESAVLLWNYNMLTEAYLGASDLENASKHNESALRIALNSPDVGEYQKQLTKGYKTEILSNQGKYKEALDRALAELEFYENNEKENSRTKVFTLSVISNIYLKLNETENAILWSEKFYDAAVDYFGLYSSDVLYALGDLLEVYIRKGDLPLIHSTIDKVFEYRAIDESQRNFKNCLPDKRMIEVAIVWAQYLGSKINKSEKDKQEFFDFLLDFEEYYANHLSIIRSSTRIEETTKSLHKIYRPALKYYSSTDAEKLFETIEKIKSFTTKIKLQSQLFENPNAMNPENDIRQLIYADDSDIKNRGFNELSNAMESFALYKDSLKNADIVEYNKYYGVSNIRLDAFRKHLAHKELAVEFILMDSTLYRFCYDGKESNVIAIDYTILTPLLKNYLKKRTADDAIALFRYLIPENYKDYKSLLIIPDDKLNYLNFEALRNEQNEFLIHHIKFRYAYSATILDYQEQLAKLKTHKNNILSAVPGFTDDLKDLYSKVATTDTSWKYFLRQPFQLSLSDKLGGVSRSISLTQEDARETRVKKLSGDYRIIHIGTHGILNDESPLFSHFIFYPDDENDGYLHTYEIYGEAFNCNLAVLSACNTGNGELLSGEGVASLSHAFTHAGCAATVITLWEVDEKATVQILEMFYKNLRKGQNKSTALHKAKVEFLKNAPEQLKDPYYWAGLVVIGSDSPIINTPWYNNYYLLAGLAALLIAFSYYFVKRYNKTS